MSTRLGWVIRGLRTGIVTTRYPARRDPEATRGVRTHPVLHPDSCGAADGCDACVRVCLPGALAIEASPKRDDDAAPQPGAALWLDLGRCIGCGLCAQTCPEGAFVMASDHELATRSRETLRMARPMGTSSANR